MFTIYLLMRLSWKIRTWFQIVLRYAILAVLSNRYPAKGGGDCHRYYSCFLYCHCYGRCDLPSHLQMVRQTWQGQQIAWWMLNHWNKKRRPLGCICGTFRGVVLCHRTILFPFAYWHYSICKSEIQYTSYPQSMFFPLFGIKSARKFGTYCQEGKKLPPAGLIVPDRWEVYIL